ncbi:hypothetical protein RUM43_011844 [Polyplax serrata]|uniref:Round spermatid basic protein 1-like protein n=1 Tax=Polyplax serrata TaxID=468196 RepID=A0AAN8PJV3_POLSC
MEVDETVKEVNSYDKSLPNSDKSQLKNSLCENDMHSSTTSEKQIMKGSECFQFSNSVIQSNGVPVKIKEEIDDDNRNNFTQNGDIKCHNNVEPLDLVHSLENNKKLNCPNIKDRPNGSSEDVITNSIKCEAKDKSNSLQNHEVKNEIKIKSETKSIESSSEKERVRDKDHTVNGTSQSHIPVSSSSPSSTPSKKHSSQSHQLTTSSPSSSSASSSTSSRHKYPKEESNHKSSSSSRNNEVSSSSRRDDDRSKSSSDSRNKSRSCHHKPEDKCHCKSRHHSRHTSKSKKYQNVKTQCTADEISFELKQNRVDPADPYFTRVPWVPHPQIANLKYGRFYRIEEDRNGGATVCHLYMDEISHLPESQMNECAVEFIKLSYSEDENECAYHVMGIVHGAASYLPDLVDYMADHYPSLIVKTGSLASRDNHTTTMSQYRDEVYKTYSNGTFRYAPLDQLSICGVLGEEVGAYFPDFVARLEQSPFMKPVMPWSFLSVVQTDNPRESNDGPIFWVRPGEQMLPANEALKESARPKKRRNNELDNLAYVGGSRYSEARESLFMDRTKAHADQVGVDYGVTNTAPTAAVGVLKAVNCGHPEHGNRATKDVVAFHAQDYNELLEILMLDLYEPPQTQCTKWIEVSKLNTLRREGIRYAHLQLHDNDVYYLPRKIIHQFQTISSVASVAWHIRYRDYFTILGAPNLHTPTGINKGQVFYEKKNVAVYCPPARENEILAALGSLEGGLKTPKKSERLREYSPFKHSPRKMHRYQSPRGKKDKAESVPPQSNVVKTESGDRQSSNDAEKNSSDSVKKRVRSNSNDNVKTDREEESLKPTDKVSENGSSGRPSSEHTPSKKERSQESHSSHRKEVKNLDAEFNSKKDKSKDEKSPKVKHGKSDDGSHSKSSKESSRHEKSSKSSSSSGSSSSSSKSKKRDHESRSSSGQSSHRVKTDERDEDSNRKRKHGDSTHHSSSKRPKDETRSTGNSGHSHKSPHKEKSEKFSDVDAGAKSGSDGAMAKKDVEVVKNTQNESNHKNTSDAEGISDSGETGNVEQWKPAVPVTNSKNTETNHKSEKTNGTCEVDLRQPMPFGGYLQQVHSFPPPPPPPPPPLPPSSPPVNPPLPPSSPVENFHPMSQRATTPPKSNDFNNVQENCVSPKEKLLDANEKKKVKKKLMKKDTDSYDLLGDIMSKMDKKKL